MSFRHASCAEAGPQQPRAQAVHAYVSGIQRMSTGYYHLIPCNWLQADQCPHGDSCASHECWSFQVELQ